MRIFLRQLARHLAQSFSLVEFVLRNRCAYFAEIAAQNDLIGKTLRLLTVEGVGFCVAGFVLGLSGRLILPAVFAMLKLPLLFLLAGVICLPTLYYFSIVFGARLRFLQTITLILTSQTVSAVLILGTTPISLLFLFSGAEPVFLTLLNIGLLGLASVLGLIFLVQGALYIQETQPPETFGWATWPALLLKGNLRSVVLLGWLAIYGLVGAQMSWALRPFFGVTLDGHDFFSALNSAIRLWLGAGR
ncbi:MAG: hypothetical protein JXA21_10065 [Anaerolineae bacterium]|nr:hypothetical protein [Anaerolineae bacterium]